MFCSRMHLWLLVCVRDQFQWFRVSHGPLLPVYSQRYVHCVCVRGSALSQSVYKAVTLYTGYPFRECVLGGVTGTAVLLKT